MFLSLDAGFQDTQIVGPRSGFSLSPDAEWIKVLDFQPLRTYLGSTMLGHGWVDDSFAIATDHTVLGAVGFASNADAISGAAGAVTDVAGNAFNGYLVAIYDLNSLLC